MISLPRLYSALLLSGICLSPAPSSAAQVEQPTPIVAVGPQYDSTHVYVRPEDVDHFTASFLATLEGQSSPQVTATVTPTPSSTSSQILHTPAGIVSLFGFKTPVPYPFGTERTGYLVTDLDVAITAARASGADILVSPFADPIGRDAIIQWPGGVNMQLYVHTVAPSYSPLRTVPDNRVYVSPDRVSAFTRSFLRFSHGKVVSDDAHAPGAEIGRPDELYHRIQIESTFGKMLVLVTDGHLPYPFGLETTGYEVPNIADTLARARAADVEVLVGPYSAVHRQSAIVRFPGGYVAEIHSPDPN